MFGPLYYYELVRLARKGRSIVLRCGYVLALFAALFLVYLTRFPSYDPVGNPFEAATTEGPELAFLAQSFVTAVLVTQTLAVLVLAPAYLAGTFVEEKRRGTLELLFTTHLSDREIVLCKLAAVATHLAGVFLAGLPLLAATQLWGGVDFTALLAAFAMAGLGLITLGSLSLYCSVTNRTTFDAFGNAYGFAVSYVGVLAFACAFFPYPIAAMAFGIPLGAALGPGLLPGTLSFVPLAGWVVANGVVSAVALRYAVTRLRSTEPESGRRKAANPVAPPPGKPREKKPSASPRVLPQFSQLGEWPLLWREINPTYNLKFVGLLDRYWPALVPSAALLGWLFPTDPQLVNLYGPLLFYLAIAMILLLYPGGVAWCAITGFCAAASVCREREQKTLDTLLTLPVSDAAVLGAKWLGAVLSWRFCYFVAAAVAFFVGFGVAHPLRALLLPVAFAAQIAFVTSLGIDVSVASRTTLRAGVVMALLLIVFFAGGWIALAVDSDAGRAVDPLGIVFDTGAAGQAANPGQMRGLFYSVGLNPIGSWVFLSGVNNWGRDLTFDQQFEFTKYAVVACAALAYASAAGLLWLHACRRLRAEQNG
jgi:ABC-type transport system involved in multi-copper enzyme maturation permease subunit